jgi:hypothetical protein
VASAATVNLPFDFTAAGTRAATAAIFGVAGVLLVVLADVVELELAGFFAAVDVVELELEPQPVMRTAARAQATTPSRPRLRRINFPPRKDSGIRSPSGAEDM